MADVSALTPSPPGVGDPSLPPAPSSPCSPSQAALIPKSTLYGDRSAMGTPSSPVGGRGSPIPPPKTPASPAALMPGEVSVANSEGTHGAESSVAAPLTASGVVGGMDPWEMQGGQEQQQHPHQKEELAASPEINPSPNLYPNVHINPYSPNPAPAPAAEAPGQATPVSSTSRPLAPFPNTPTKDSESAPQAQDPASVPLAGTEEAQTAAAAAVAVEATPPPPVAPSQAQPPQPPPQNAKPQLTPTPTPTTTTTSNPLSSPAAPKPTSPATPGASKRALEPPGTPVRTDPPVLVVQDSGPTLPLPHHSRPAPDTLSYLESASMMSGTLESLSGLGEDGSSVGSDSEINGVVMRRTDKYGFLGGTQYSDAGDVDVRVEVARQREMKWLDMFNHWDKWVTRRFQKVKLRCRKGVPSSLRAKAWQLLSNSKELLDANPGKFEELEREPGDPKWLDIIEKDLHRQFPFHEMFAARGGHGQQDLYRILKAYTVYRPDEGYCQAQAPVAAVLLMHMPAEQAFWCLVQICERYLPGYYSAGLEAIQLDGEIFFSLLRRVCPMAYRHLKKFKIDPILYMTEWFMCIFSRTLPWSCVLRVWDMFFCEGVKVVFRVGLVLLKQMLGSVDKLRELQGMYETMEKLRNIPPESINEHALIQEIISLPVTEALIERECTVQVRKWRESRGELNHQPGRRLHGTRAIFEQKRRAASISSGGSLSFLGTSIPPPGPLRASSSLLSLPGFRKSKTPFHFSKKTSLSGPSGVEAMPLQELSSGGGGGGGGGKAPPHGPSPLVGNSAPSSPTPQAQASAQGQASGQERPILASRPPSGHNQNQNQNQGTPSRTLAPSPKVTAEQVTPTLPSPTANNAPLPPCSEPATAAATKTATAGGEEKAPAAAPVASTGGGEGEEDGKKKKKSRSKDDKKRDKEEEKQRAKEKKEREKADKERQKREKDRAEKERKKGGKKKEKGGGGGSATAGAEEKNGAATARDLA